MTLTPTLSQGRGSMRSAAASFLIVLALPAAAETRSTPLTHFGAPSVLSLQGEGASASVDFGHRADELVTRATLRVRYISGSPIRVTMNGEAIGLLPTTPRGDAKP